ncbi:MAG: nucleoside recognition domain-containing protein [ANME-2 cluster archaeon]|nr:nucleoside recognition domain-containing protein [ANME-2 cluster archaeon]
MWLDALYYAIEYLLRIIPPTVLGIFIMEWLVEMGLVARLGFVTAPFMRFAHLREDIGVSFLASFGSPTAGNSMVAQMYNKGIIDRRETILASLINSFPSTIVILRNMLPVIVILLGTTGLIYLGVVVFVGLLRTVLTLVVGRFLLEPKEACNIDCYPQKGSGVRVGFRNAARASARPLKRIIITMTVVSIVVFQLIDMGFFDTVSVYLNSSFITRYVPVDGLPIIAGWFASNIAAYTIAGNLLTTGMLSSKDIVITLLIGRMLSSIVRMRSSLPFYVGIFKSDLGVPIMLISLIMQDSIMLVITVVLVMFW